jgi:Ca2+-binding RTX toxin-like protein
MQIALSATFGLNTLGLASVGDSLALYLDGGTGFLLYDDGTSNGVSALSLGTVSAAGSGFLTTEDLASASFLSLQPGVGLTVQEAGSVMRLFSFDAGGTLMTQVIGTNGLPGTATAAVADGASLSGVGSFEILGGAAGTQAALSFGDDPGLRIYGLSAAGTLTHEADIADTAKSYLGNVSDTLSLSVGGSAYLLTLSSLEGGITSLSVDAKGHASLVDSLGTIDGMALSGAAAMQAVDMGGTTFVVIASTNSSSLTVVRVNDMGCLFATDTVYDDASTRFYHPEVLDTFSWAGRSFVVTGGTDAGLSVFEMRPDGMLTPFATGVFETGAGLGAITGLEAAVSGSVAGFYVVDASNQKILDYSMDLSATGGMIMAAGGTTTGTSLGDFIWGGNGAQNLNGGSGDDWIYDGTGADTLTGGAGADVFLFAADGTDDKVSDFALHSDRIDLSDWGRIYSATSLLITQTATGATIAWGSQSISLTSADGKGIAAGSFTDADFIFS